jgi:uncharacterized protein YjhX (UPF0386 family)
VLIPVTLALFRRLLRRKAGKQVSSLPETLRMPFPDENKLVRIVFDNQRLLLSTANGGQLAALSIEIIL